MFMSKYKLSKVWNFISCHTLYSLNILPFINIVQVHENVSEIQSWKDENNEEMKIIYNKGDPLMNNIANRSPITGHTTH